MRPENLFPNPVLPTVQAREDRRILQISPLTLPSPRRGEGFGIGSKRIRTRHRRGAAIVSFVAALLIIGTFVLWLFQLTATTSRTSLGHHLSTGAFYAAESGLEMAMRELTATPPTDFDSDGTIGTISDNGSDADDPALATGAVFVERIGTTPPTYRATGRPVVSTAPWNGYRRVVEVQTQ